MRVTDRPKDSGPGIVVGVANTASGGGRRPSRRASIWALAPVILLAGLLLSACDLVTAGQASQTTPDIEGTVTAAVQTALATQVAIAPTPTTSSMADIEATLSAPVRTALAAQATALAPQPTATQSATPVAPPLSTPTPSPTETPTPTPTPVPTLTATPAATRTPEARFSEIEVSYRLRLYFAEQYELTESAYMEFLFQLANSPGDRFIASALGWDSEAAQRGIWLWTGRYNGKMQPNYEGKGAWLVTVSDIVFGDKTYAPTEQWWFFESGASPPLMARPGQ